MSIKINFSDTYRDFDNEHNFITDIIEKYVGSWELSPDPDFLFFSCSGTEHYKYDKAVKILFLGEPVVPNFSICDYAIGFADIKYGDRYCKRPAWMDYHAPTECKKSDKELLDRKFCNFIYSNESRGTAVELRKQFAKRLMEYKAVDCPGRVLNNMPSDVIAPRRGDWRQGKIDFIGSYKFTIAFENCQMPGYSSEKIEDPLIAHSIPIYWGDPQVGLTYNENAIINCNGCEDDWESIIDRIIYLDTHDDEYLKMIKEYPNNPAYTPESIEEFVVRIINTGSDIIRRDPLNYGRVMTVPELRTAELLKLLGKKFYEKIH